MRYLVKKHACTRLGKVKDIFKIRTLDLPVLKVPRVQHRGQVTLAIIIIIIIIIEIFTVSEPTIQHFVRIV